MRHGKLVLLTGVMAAFSGAMMIAQTGGGMKALAEIKGDGITGRAELVERRQGTGTVVESRSARAGSNPGSTAFTCMPSASAKLRSRARAGTSTQALRATPIPTRTTPSTWATYRTSKSARTAKARSKR